MAQGFAADDEENDERARPGSSGADRHHDHDVNHDPNHDDSHCWPSEAPSAEVARVALKIDQAITSKRTAAAAWLTTYGQTVPSLPRCLPLKPTRMELAVLIALAETFGSALYQDPRFMPVLDFIADCGAVALVQRVMYGARPKTDFDVTGLTAENASLNGVLRDARVAFEFLCATWPEVFLAQTHAVLARIGVRVLPVDAGPMPSSAGEETADDDEGDGEGRDKGDDADKEDGDG
ncbi:hypothetical protein [Caballeronia sp. HLA56]